MEGKKNLSEKLSMELVQREIIFIKSWGQVEVQEKGLV